MKHFLGLVVFLELNNIDWTSIIGSVEKWIVCIGSKIADVQSIVQHFHCYFHLRIVILITMAICTYFFYSVSELNDYIRGVNAIVFLHHMLKIPPGKRPFFHIDFFLHTHTQRKEWIRIRLILTVFKWLQLLLTKRTFKIECLCTWIWIRTGIQQLTMCCFNLNMFQQEFQ